MFFLHTHTHNSQIYTFAVLTCLIFCFYFPPHHRAKTSCPHSPKLRSWTGVNCWGRKGKPNPPWSASSPSLPVRSGQRSETLTLVRAGAAPPCSSFNSHAAGWLPCPHPAPLWLIDENFLQGLTVGQMDSTGSKSDHGGSCGLLWWITRYKIELYCETWEKKVMGTHGYRLIILNVVMIEW